LEALRELELKKRLKKPARSREGEGDILFFAEKAAGLGAAALLSDGIGAEGMLRMLFRRTKSSACSWIC